MMKRHMLNWLQRGVLALVTVWVLGEEPNAIKSIDVTSVSDSRQVLTVVTEKPMQPPGSFTVNTPPRIAFDFANTINDSGRSSVPVASGNIRSVKLAEAAGRTRLVLEMSHSASYDTKVESNKLTVTFNSAAQETATPQLQNTSTQFSASQNTSRESIRGIDFRRGDTGEGRVVVDLSSPKIGIDISQQGKDLVLVFAKTAMPRQFERRMDVADYGTPVQTVDSYTQGETAKIVVSPKGNWEYSAYQTDNKFVVEIKNPDEAAKRIASLEKPVYKGDKLSLNFQNIEVRTVLEVIAEFTGKNIITSDTVTGNLTLRLKDVPWDQVLDLILQSKGLDKRENGAVMWIAPRDEIASREKLVLEAKQQTEELEPLKSQSFQLNYLKADTLKALFADKNNTILSKRGAVVIEPTNNILFVQDIPDRLSQIAKLIAVLDAPSKQVMIEARIVSASDSFGRTLGVRLGLASQRVAGNNVFNTVTGFNLAGGTASAASGSSGSSASSGSSGSTGSTSGTTTGAGSSTALTSFFNQQITNVNLPNTGTTGGDFGVSIFNAAVGGLIGLELQALEAEGTGKIISSPRVVTKDQTKATIKQGTKIPFLMRDAQGNSQESFIDAELILDVTPRVTPDGRIFMELDITNNSPTTFNGQTSIDEKSIHTSVLVGNGDTAVLGGIYQSTDTLDETKVPLLGDIPILGALFRQKSVGKQHNELLIFITPKILPVDPLIK